MTGDLPADNRLALRRVVRACRKAALATCMADGAPYASLVTVAFGHDMAPLLLLSGLSDHTRNLGADPRASLLFDGTEGLANPQTGPRVTLTGTAEPCADDALRRRFLARHPAAVQYAGFGDFGLWRVRPARAHFVGGFARAVWFDAPFGIDPAVAAALAADEADILAGAQADILAGEAGWRVAAVDIDGCDIARGEDVCRVAFAAPLTGGNDARHRLAGKKSPQP
jgi:putative heme iron utilization protein